LATWQSFRVSATTRYDHTAVLTLALDTTTRAGSVAVVHDTTVLSVVLGDEARTHGERLPGELELALQRARVAPRDLDLLAVASGPGAFTGLRIGLAAIQGLAMVLRIPVIAISALDALAVSLGTVPAHEGQSLLSGSGATGSRSLPPTAAWMDAARGEVFAAYYAAAEGRGAAVLSGQMSEAVVATPQAILMAMPKVPGTVFIGDGAVRYAAHIQQHFEATHRIEPAPAALAPIIAILGRDGAARGEAGPPHALQPLYVRRPDAEIARANR
jgi:tRNA threonylcarbamoyladenosine biosynthesis protein TsaB